MPSKDERVTKRAEQMTAVREGLNSSLVREKWHFTVQGTKVLLYRPKKTVIQSLLSEEREGQ